MFPTGDSSSMITLTKTCNSKLCGETWQKLVLMTGATTEVAPENYCNSKLVLNI